MIYGFIEFIYVAAFVALFEKKGFRWQWFLPLAAAFIVATVSRGFMSGGNLPFSMVSGGAEDRLQVLSSFMYILFLPIHAFITVRVMKALPGHSPLFDRLLARLLAYIAAAMAAGFIFSVLMMLGMAAYCLVAGLPG